ncbi:uncharacterized protein LOC6565519 [Drosophila grimshawi]|uniref:GH12650 n=1 Tax=Drosophila grimshawi TaxID=7222 RepID=B4JKF4_DROGR|nr:uncharacterized protein LOC6565519 [Drosophila grimshawi]EDW00057.1 GH12650 [Drosophila grimshawi]
MFNWRFKLILLLAQTLSINAGYIGGGELAAGIHSPGLLGSYAGALSGGQALAKLDLGGSDAYADEHVDHEELGALNDHISEHSGTLGDHLSEHSFPSDYGSSDAGVEYAEASEHHEHYESEPKLELDLEEHHGEQPVPGIDHGKGAFSYSTLYEFKDREEHEQHQLEHQQQEEHISHQLELEHQHNVLEHQLDFH